MSKKYNAALGAYEIIKQKEGPLVLGIGTGSTTDYFTKDFLLNLKDKVTALYSSSERTTKLLLKLGLQVSEYNPNNTIDIYVDGADEVDKDLNLIKGGGGAHTNEKKLAKQAKEFICIIDDQKLVNCLGEFPLPVEVKIAEANEVIPVLKQFSNNISKRESLSDSGNYLYDIHDFKIENPNRIEEQILSMNGIVDVGIFSINKPSTVVVGLESSYKLIES
jgi:ribose 5-phosphate isomerase A|tara:strand:- start:697 stop:1356 length:660 start_codon:yes stop_codon:yes gene_type:complete